MTERHPDDATLLALLQDQPTGVEYIPTGRSPYYLEFRRMLHRLLRAAERANDLRVYQDGDLSIGVRPGRAFVAGEAIAFTGITDVPLAADATTHIWLDDTGTLQTSTDALPDDRTTFVPLATIITGPSAIESIVDLRGQAFLAIPSLAMFNVEATADELNQALSGIESSVTAAALSTLTGGGMTSADTFHRHLGVPQHEDAEASFNLINHSDHADANVALRFALPQIQAADTFLLLNKNTGFLQQRHLGVAYNLLGAVQPQHRHEGDLTASLTGALIGAVPADGEVTDVILSIGSNIESDDDDDGVSAAVHVNGDPLTDTHPALTADDGPGFVSTAQIDGTPAVIVTNGAEHVQRGDILTLDLTRTANGNITSEAHDITVLVVIRVNAPE